MTKIGKNYKVSRFLVSRFLVAAIWANELTLLEIVRNQKPRNQKPRNFLRYTQPAQCHTIAVKHIKIYFFINSIHMSLVRMLPEMPFGVVGHC